MINAGRLEVIDDHGRILRVHVVVPGDPTPDYLPVAFDIREGDLQQTLHCLGGSQEQRVQLLEQVLSQVTDLLLHDRVWDIHLDTHPDHKSFTIRVKYNRPKGMIGQTGNRPGGPADSSYRTNGLS